MNIKRVISIIAVLFIVFGFNVFSQENTDVIIMLNQIGDLSLEDGLLLLMEKI